MNITLNQKQIEAYIKEGLRRRVQLYPSEDFTLDLMATRGPEGYTCVASVSSDAIVVAKQEEEPEYVNTPESDGDLSGATSSESKAEEEPVEDTRSPEASDEPTQTNVSPFAKRNTTAPVKADPETASEETEETEETEAPAASSRPSIFSNLKKPSNRPEADANLEEA